MSRCSVILSLLLCNLAFSAFYAPDFAFLFSRQGCRRFQCYEKEGLFNNDRHPHSGARFDVFPRNYVATTAAGPSP